MDGILLGALGFALLSLFLALFGPTIRIELDGRAAPDVDVIAWRALVDAALLAAVSASYSVAFWTRRSSSPGQAVFGIAVTDRNSSPLTCRRALLRWALLGAPLGVVAQASIDLPLLFVLVAGLGLAWIGTLLATTVLSGSGRGLHDRISGSNVIRISRG